MIYGLSGWIRSSEAIYSSGAKNNGGSIIGKVVYIFESTRKLTRFSDPRLVGRDGQQIFYCSE